MRTRFLLACAALCMAGIAISAGESQERLYSAIRADDLRQIKALLDQGVSAWLLHPTPVTTEDFDMRLVGAAAGAPVSDLRKLAEPIFARQRPDGGFAQRDGFPSDAYATGMTLWALANAGVVQPNQDVYRKASNFCSGRRTRMAPGM